MYFITFKLIYVSERKTQHKIFNLKNFWSLGAMLLRLGMQNNNLEGTIFRLISEKIFTNFGFEFLLLFCNLRAQF